MDLLQTIWTYVSQLLSNFLTWVVTGGGIVIFTAWRKRVRIDAKCIGEGFDGGKVTFSFEITNLSELSTSVKKECFVKLFGGVVGKCRCVMHVIESSRYLEPHRQTLIRTRGKLNEHYPLFLFGHINLKLNKGFSKTVYFFNTPRNAVPIQEFYLAYLRYRLFKTIPKNEGL